MLQVVLKVRLIEAGHIKLTGISWEWYNFERLTGTLISLACRNGWSRIYVRKNRFKFVTFNPNTTCELQVYLEKADYLHDIRSFDSQLAECIWFWNGIFLHTPFLQLCILPSSCPDYRIKLITKTCYCNSCAA